ncbi:MAG: hypothetical protein SFY68_02890 [Candidatus Sumerlaeia bacterium]|nr:hypothetical protein [Candidatus Sumerlaeia bacterium]
MPYVTHCICENRSFQEIVDWATTHNTTDLGLIRETFGCTGHCGICKPYIQYALATGVVRVPYPCPDLPGQHQEPAWASYSPAPKRFTP